MTKAGVLVREHRLQPSAKGKRLLFTNNNLRVIDGSFLESKELIGGFAVLELSGGGLGVGATSADRRR